MIRVAAAAIGVTVGLYWLGVGSAGPQTGGSGFRVLVALFTCFWLAAAVQPLSTRAAASRVRSTLAIVALGTAMFAAAGPLLLWAWTRADYERFLWIIRQGAPCDAMGGGPGMLWVFGTSWLSALAAAVYAIAAGLTVRQAGQGVALGLALCAATAAAMFPAPDVFAFVLGCIR